MRSDGTTYECGSSEHPDFPSLLVALKALSVSVKASTFVKSCLADGLSELDAKHIQLSTSAALDRLSSSQDVDAFITETLRILTTFNQVKLVESGSVTLEPFVKSFALGTHTERNRPLGARSYWTNGAVVCTSQTDFSVVSFLIYVLFVKSTYVTVLSSTYLLDSPTPQSLTLCSPTEGASSLFTTLLLELYSKVNVEDQTVNVFGSDKTSTMSSVTAPTSKVGSSKRRFSTTASPTRYTVKIGDRLTVAVNDPESLIQLLSILRGAGYNVTG